METMDTYWIPGVNHLGTHGRWAFAEFTDIWEIQDNFQAEIQKQFDRMIGQAGNDPRGERGEALK